MPNETEWTPVVGMEYRMKESPHVRYRCVAETKPGRFWTELVWKDGKVFSEQDLLAEIYRRLALPEPSGPMVDLLRDLAEYCDGRSLAHADEDLFSLAERAKKLLEVAHASH